MISRYTHKKLNWIDLESPTKEEVREVMDEYGFHPLIADELLSPTVRPKVDLYDNLIYLIIHFPAVSYVNGHSGTQEIDFVIGKDFLITTHYELVDPLHEFSKVFEVNSILDKSDMGKHAGFLFFYIIKELYRKLILELDHIDEQLEDIEERIFLGEEPAMVKKISRVNRDLLNVRQAIRPHKEVLDSFELAGTQFFGDDFTYHLRSIIGEYYKVFNILEGHKETVLDLRDTNDSLLTTKTNETMKTLTIMAFMAFPLTLITGVFGMNIKFIPFAEDENGLLAILGLMTVTGIVMFIYFKVKKWI
ncbi:MAG: magnesium transporter CorA family protein [Candidatus Pacebacteria bacterium]|nr:magnesium transporter CorA family protein [Candidatus Paceibacterota bacterium]MCK5590958.1 magnesium transporter CorA family protein [Candidatus Paceibacterota bacterium]